LCQTYKIGEKVLQIVLHNQNGKNKALKNG